MILPIPLTNQNLLFNWKIAHTMIVNELKVSGETCHGTCCSHSIPCKGLCEKKYTRNADIHTTVNDEAACKEREREREREREKN